jgi:YVTN family beta-propeller protein/autotransporter-associated beta strand protein
MGRSTGEVSTKIPTKVARTRVAMALISCLWSVTAAHAQVTSYAVIPNFASGNVSFIDTATNAVVLSPNTGGSPSCVAVTADGSRAYVATDTNGVVMVDMSSGISSTVLPATGATCIAVTPDTRKGYFSSATLNTVTPFDTATNTAGTPIAVSGTPQVLAVTPNGQRLYVATAATASLTVIDTTADTVIGTIALSGTSATAIAIAPDGLRAYVADYGSNAVSVVDLTSNTEILPAISLVAMARPVAIAVTPDGTKVFTANLNDESVSVIDTATSTVTTTVPLPPGGVPQGVAVSNDGQTVYVVDGAGQQVLLFDVATNTFGPTPIAVGSQPVAYTGFMSPNYVEYNATNTPLSIASDADLTAAGFGTSYLPFLFGTLKLTASTTTARTVSLVGDATIDTNGHDLTLTSGIVGQGTLIPTGGGTLILSPSASATHTGQTRLMSGTLQVDGTHTADIRLIGGTLSGSGTVGHVIGDFGTIKPGGATPGTLTVSTLAMTQSTLQVRLNGTAPGSYDRLQATSTANLNNCFFTPILNYTPVPGDSFVVVTNATGTFSGFPEGSFISVTGAYLHITYHGGASGHDVVLTVNAPPTLTDFPSQDVFSGATLPPIPFTIGDDFTDPSALTIILSSSTPDILPESNIVVTGTGASRALNVTLVPNKVGQALLTVLVRDGAGELTYKALSLSVFPKPLTYYLAEGATSDFFSTDILLANPNNAIVPITITFFKADGTTIEQPFMMSPTSRITLPAKFVQGLEAASFSTSVVSTSGLPIAVERTMWWDQSGYGAHGEKASAGPALTWYFAEGSQGFFHTYFLLLNQNATANVAHVTYFLEDGSPLQKDYPLAPTSRTTIDIASEAALQNRSFGAQITFDQPGMAERAMYFGEDPLFSGGTDSSGTTAPSTSWFLAEGATGSYFDTFVLIANPGDTDATVTTTYLPASGLPVPKTHVVAAHQRLTINIATEDPSLASAAVGTSVTSDHPVIVERSQYWPHGNWYEAHNSAGETAAGTKWALAEGRVGGNNHAQTYILLANSGTQPAEVTATFLRENDPTTPIVKTFIVPPTSRLNIAVTGPGSDVPELADENFGTSLLSTQPIIVERSMYTDAGGVTWAAGTNATATRMP